MPSETVALPSSQSTRTPPFAPLVVTRAPLKAVQAAVQAAAKADLPGLQRATSAGYYEDFVGHFGWDADHKWKL